MATIAPSLLRTPMRNSSPASKVHHSSHIPGIIQFTLPKNGFKSVSSSPTRTKVHGQKQRLKTKPIEKEREKEKPKEKPKPVKPVRTHVTPPKTILTAASVPLPTTPNREARSPRQRRKKHQASPPSLSPDLTPESSDQENSLLSYKQPPLANENAKADVLQPKQPTRHKPFLSESLPSTPAMTWQQEMLSTLPLPSTPSPSNAARIRKDELTFGLISAPPREAFVTPPRDRQRSASGPTQSLYMPSLFDTPLSASSRDRFAASTYHNAPAACTLPVPSFVLRKMEALAVGIQQD